MGKKNKRQRRANAGGRAAGGASRGPQKRRRKGKGRSGGAGGSLVNRAAQIRRERHARDMELQRQAVGERRENAKRSERRRQNARVPYTAHDKILLVGEGNFSFARALVRLLFADQPNRSSLRGDIVATAYDSLEEVHSKYPQAKEVIEEVELHGVSVLGEVDATKLEEHKGLKEAVDCMLGGDPSGGDVASRGFDRIVFNFPHTGCGVKDTLRNIRIHQELLTGYFRSATNLLRVSLGENLRRPQIHVTIKTGEPYASWQVARLARQTGLLQLLTTIDFVPEKYPGYEHRRTRGAYIVPKNEESSATTTTTTTTTSDAGDDSAPKARRAGANRDINRSMEHGQLVGARTYIFVPVKTTPEKLLET